MSSDAKKRGTIVDVIQRSRVRKVTRRVLELNLPIPLHTYLNFVAAKSGISCEALVIDILDDVLNGEAVSRAMARASEEEGSE